MPSKQLFAGLRRAAFQLLVRNLSLAYRAGTTSSAATG